MSVSGVGMHLVSGAAAAEDTSYEAPPEFMANEILTPDMQSGENFQVEQRVSSDGYWDIYTVKTEFGDFEARSWMALRKLIREINAIAELQKMTKTEAFIESAVENGILEPINLAVTIVTNPVKTVSGIPRGIGNMFKRYGRRAKKTIDDTKKVLGDNKQEQVDPRIAEACRQGNESTPSACDDAGYKDDFKKLSSQYFKVDDAARKWHAELGTDPYSSNDVLHESIKKVSWASGLGEFGLKYTPLGGIKAIGVTREVYSLTWSKDPFELREYLEKSLADLNIDAQSRKYFMDNPYISPTRQTFIVKSLMGIGAIEGMETLIDWAADSRDEAEALYSAASVSLIAWMHSQSNIVRILPNTILPVIETKEGRVLAMLPIDYLSWSEEVATIVEAASLRDEVQQISNREIWLASRCSDIARNNLQSLGWTVTEDGFQNILDSVDSVDSLIPD